jgi:hypothetical protein
VMSTRCVECNPNHIGFSIPVEILGFFIHVNCSGSA